MKRYWKIISICLITILVIGTFYIQSSFATDNHVKIEFEKVSGNEEALQNITLYTTHFPNNSNLHQPLQSTSEETIDPTNLSFSQKISRLGVPYYLEDLVKKHKNFMRSKHLNPNYFFEDDNVVAYAQIKNPDEQDFSFDIEVLTKKTDEITSIRLDVPEKEQYGWMVVEDIQVIDEKLKVIARGFRLDARQYELRVYTFDKSQQKLISNDIIASILDIENGYSTIRTIHDEIDLHRQKYLLIKTETFELEETYSDDTLTLAVNELIVYDIENNQSKKIVGSNDILASIDDSSAIYHSTLFIPSHLENNLQINQYDIENDRWGEVLSFELSDIQVDRGVPYTKIINGKLYTIYPTPNGYNMIIGDLQTGELLYEGQLKMKNQGEELQNYRLYFDRIESIQ